jgi:hypothetical protein
MSSLIAYARQLPRYLIEANFYLSLTLMLIACALSVSDSYTLFEFNVDIYGELANHLRIVMANLGVTELLIFGCCWVTKQYQYYLIVGFFLILTIASLEVYGQFNDVEIDQDLDIFLFYVGMSHGAFGALKNNNT